MSGSSVSGTPINAQPYSGAHRFISGIPGGIPSGVLGYTNPIGTGNYSYPSEQTFMPNFDSGAVPTGNTQPQGEWRVRVIPGSDNVYQPFFAAPGDNSGLEYDPETKRAKQFGKWFYVG